MLMAWFSNSDWLDDKKTTLFLTVAVASGSYGRHVKQVLTWLPAHAAYSGGWRGEER